MNKIKTLGVLVGILALINICLVIFLIMGRPKGPIPGHMGKENAEKFVKDKFKFDDVQMKAFKTSKEKHAENIRRKQKELEVLSRTYYTTVSSNRVATKDSLLSEINALSTEIYKINNTHFEEVRAICQPNQLVEMEGFINGLLNQKGRREK